MTRAPHANFDTYLNDFTDGLTKYQCKSEDIDNEGFDWYKESISANIERLESAYPKIKEPALQEMACDIGYALSKSYQIQQGKFFFNYLFYQNRLISLKNSVGRLAKIEIYYVQSFMSYLSNTPSWSL